DEAKDRPLYIVQKSYGIDNKRLYRDQHMS
ncbi:hypothetical protein MOE95_12050, partial [Bacillus spizizenii]|nr:hypothetical protein [Bacillus spizizenii]